MFCIKNDNHSLRTYKHFETNTNKEMMEEHGFI